MLRERGIAEIAGHFSASVGASTQENLKILPLPAKET
jgi:hypothetical protein